MPHKIAGRRLNRSPSHRKAMMRNMVTSLIVHGKIKTTDERAKELRIVADKMVTLGKRGDLHARRQALRVVRSLDAIKILFDDLAKRFADRPGGYTRITKIGFRHGDNAKMSVIEYLPAEEKKAKAAKKSRRKPAAKKAAEKKPAAKKAAVKGEKKEAAKKPAAKKKAAEKAKPAKGAAKAKDDKPKTAKASKKKTEKAAEEKE